ncbi:FG-GAP and VCBS repeat-containing protein [Streptomyces sp. NPDC048717]|uniref:FG-GAP and VCBS repeat-containing protein n=1 Tax=Streptomyces sp. NPDC048717 TaxID=3154928 RepID=UPI0034236082
MRPTRTATAVAAVLAAVAAGPLATAQPAAAAPAPAKLSDDFNGDGYRDLVLLGGTYQKDYRVDVVYGTANGPGARVQTIHQSQAAIPGTTEEGDFFGQSATSADLDRDGYADLILASPGEAVGTATRRGGLTVVWGGSGGLGSGTVFHSPVPVADTGQKQGDAFGREVLAGDFDGDGDQDLAAVSESRSGGVVLLKGPFTRAGKTSGHALLGGNYGLLQVDRLVAGRVTADSATDLYILGQDLTRSDSEVQAYFHRGGSGFATLASSVRLPDSDPTDGQLSRGPFGIALGDFDKDGYGDLAVGRSAEPFGKESGYVVVQYGGATGPNTTRKPVKLSQDTAGVPGTSEDGDLFGYSLAAGDVNGDGYADLAVGAPGEDLGSSRDAGAVTVLLGRAGGLSGTGSKAYDQNKPGIGGNVERDDNFGNELRMADYNRDGRADLMVETDDWVGNKLGMVHLLKGSASGITGTGSKDYTASSLKLSYNTFGGWFAR